MANICAVASQGKGLEVAMVVDPEVPVDLVGDPLRLQQILVNLVGNAIKFTSVGHVAVNVDLLSREGEGIEVGFRVEDSGIGMTDEQQRRIFHPFAQADGSMTRRFGGTGLGLAISKRLSEMMGGRLGVRSKMGAAGRQAVEGRFGVARNFAGGVGTVFGQGPGLSPSVFNFFSPGYAPPGEIQSQGMVSPEMQLATEYLNTQVTNYFWTQASARTVTQAPTLNADDMYIDTSEEIALAADSEALVNRVADRLLGGAAGMSAVLKAQAKAQVERSTNSNTRVADAIYLIAVSPEYILQR